MKALLLLCALAAADAPTPEVRAHGVRVLGPEGWARSLEDTTVVFTSPQKDASLRIDTFEKPAQTEPQACLDQIIDKLSNGDKAEKKTYAPGFVDGQPAATQVKFTDGRKQRERRAAGCNGRSYFLVDWVEASHAGPKYEPQFQRLLSTVHFEPLAAPKADR